MVEASETKAMKPRPFSLFPWLLVGIACVFGRWYVDLQVKNSIAGKPMSQSGDSKWTLVQALLDPLSQYGLCIAYLICAGIYLTRNRSFRSTAVWARLAIGLLLMFLLANTEFGLRHIL